MNTGNSPEQRRPGETTQEPAAPPVHRGHTHPYPGKRQSAEPVAFLTAHGAYDTHAVTLRNGAPNRRARAGTPYSTVSWDEIKELAAHPLAQAKNEAQFIIPSRYTSHDGRNHKVQRELGIFDALAVDIDDGDAALEEVAAAVNDVAGSCESLIYSSSSATSRNKKWRVLIPLGAPVAGADYADTQEALFTLLGERKLACDSTLKRTAQPIYLPNVPPGKRARNGSPLFYQWRHHPGNTLVIDPAHPIYRKRNEIRQHRQKRQEESRKRREENAALKKARGDDFDAIEHFNAHHRISDLLNKYGFEQGGSTDGSHWRCELSESGSFSTQDFGDHWVTVSAWAEKYDVGTESQSGHRYGDAFDLFVHFEHDGQRKEAIQDYTDKVRPEIERRKARCGGEEASAASSRKSSSDTQPGPANLNDDTTLTDTGLARRLAIKGAAMLSYQRDQSRWMAYNGRHWEPDDGIAAESVGKAVSDDLWQELANVLPVERRTSRSLISFLKSSASQQTIKAAVVLARSEPQIGCLSNQFDSKHYVLNVKNGTLDLDALLLQTHNADDKITHLANVDYDKGAGCPRWQQFVEDVMDGDDEVISFLQRSAGLLLTGDVTDQVLWMHFGDGANGKSTFLKTLETMLSSYAATAAPDMLVHKHNRTREAENQYAVLEGKRFLMAIEQDEGVRLSEATVKQLTGGDTISARRLYHESFTMQPTWKIHMAVNHKPLVRGNDYGIWRRVLAIPWEQEFAGNRADKNLQKKLLQELPGILNWCIAGYTQWRAHGLEIPEKVRLATSTYRKESNSVLQWINEECTIDSGSCCEALVLYANYCHWCATLRESPVSHKLFAQQLDRRGFHSERPTSGIYRKKTIRHGLSLLLPGEVQQEKEDAAWDAGSSQ